MEIDFGHLNPAVTPPPLPTQAGDVAQTGGSTRLGRVRPNLTVSEATYAPNIEATATYAPEEVEEPVRDDDVGRAFSGYSYPPPVFTPPAGENMVE